MELKFLVLVNYEQQIKVRAFASSECVALVHLRRKSEIKATENLMEPP